MTTRNTKNGFVLVFNVIRLIGSLETQLVVRFEIKNWYYSILL